jgi:hypothetical protein
LIQQLTPLELRLISPRVIIMTTVTSTSGQRGVRGQTMSFVNSSVGAVTRVLPRLMDDAAVVNVRITQSVSGVVRKEPVRPELLRRVLKRCIRKRVAAYEDVVISERRLNLLREHNAPLNVTTAATMIQTMRWTLKRLTTYFSCSTSTLTTWRKQRGALCKVACWTCMSCSRRSARPRTTCRPAVLSTLFFTCFATATAWYPKV